MSLADILRANAERARSEAESHDLPAFRRCLAAVLTEAISHARSSGDPESYVFLSPRHGSPEILRAVAAAVRDRGSSRHFEAAMDELAEQSGLPVLVGLTGAGKVVFIFGRDAPEAHRGNAGGPVRLRGKPVGPRDEPAAKPARAITSGVRLLPSPNNLMDITLHPRPKDGR